jgi:alpha-beta hydrolase superfamily lysophospholipase
LRLVKESGFSFQNREGLPIRADIALPGRSAAPFVVCVHGFKGFKDWGFWPETARRLANAGYGVLRFNFSHSGIGQNPQAFTEMELFETGTFTREVQDLGAVLGLLARGSLPGAEGLEVSGVGLLAHSRGAVSALAVAADGDMPVDSVVLWNPVSTVSWWDEDTRRRWRESGFWEVENARTHQVFRMRTGLLEDAEQNRERLHPVVNAGKLRAPLLCVVAAADETVPPAAGRRIATAAGERGCVQEIPGTGHTFGAAHPFTGTTPALEEALRLTLEHFVRTLGRVT